MTKATKVGAIALLVMSVLFYFYPSTSTRDSEVFGGQYSFIFSQVCGLRESDAVKLAGVTIGRVNSIDFTTPEQRATFGDDGHVVVTCGTDFGVVIPDDSSVGIGQRSGQPCWVDIMPGLSTTNVKNGSISRLRTQESPTEQLTSGLARMSELRESTKELRLLVNDRKFRQRVHDLASNARFYTTQGVAYSREAKKMVADMDKRLDQEQGGLLRQIARCEIMLAQGQERMLALIPRVNEGLQSWENRIRASGGQIKAMMAMAQRETDRFNAITTRANTMLEAHSQDFADKKAKLHSLAKKLKDLASMAEDLSYLTSDAEVQQTLRDLAAKYRAQSEAIVRKLHKLEGISDPEPSPSTAPDSAPTEPASNATPATTPAEPASSVAPATTPAEPASNAAPATTPAEPASNATPVEPAPNV